MFRIPADLKEHNLTPMPS